MAKKMDWSLASELTKQTQAETEKMEKVHVLIVGKTGVGKSTLVNSLFREKLAETGVGRPITKHLQRIEKEGVPMVLYDTRGLELDAKGQAAVTGEIDQTLAKMQEKGEKMDVAYYCINANSSRIEPMEIRLIKYLASKMPVILILTQSIGESAINLEKYLINQNLPVQAIIRVMAKDYVVTDDFKIPVFGLKELVERSFGLLPSNLHSAFNNAQQIDIQRKSKAARRWARRYIVSTFSVGFTPIPFSDATVLVPMQVGMMAHITAIFGVSLDYSTALGLIGAIGGTGSATYVGRLLVSNIAKFIPGAGSVVGGMISGTTASIITTALAMSYIEVLTYIAKQEAKGEEVTPKAVRDMMKAQYNARLKRGKDDPDYQAARKEINQEQKRTAGKDETAVPTEEATSDQLTSQPSRGQEEDKRQPRISWPKWSRRSKRD